MKVVISGSAAAELEEIGDYIAARNPARAVSFVQELRERCEGLVDAPRTHALVPRYERAGIRRCVHGNYLIFFRIETDSIVVVHILHGARDYEAILFPEG
jgi:plasmid stabilization system protein ParE